MKTHLEISITAAGEEERELLIPVMLDLGCTAFQEAAGALLCYVTLDRPESDPRAIQALKARIETRLRSLHFPTTVRFQEIREQNWNAQWEKTIQPVDVTGRIVVKPSWATYDNAAGKIVLQIDPKMSFGTGYHETTRLTLGLLEEHLQPGWRVLDVGTGTGILAIAAIKLGAVSAVGTDFDEWALDNATENIGVNGVRDMVEIVNKPPGAFPPSSFDLITANLMLNTILEMLGDFRRVLRDGGVALLSGLLAHDRERVAAELGRKGFAIAEERIEHEWIAIAARKQ